jgi:hypothetical protein
LLRGIHGSVCLISICNCASLFRHGMGNPISYCASRAVDQ